MALVYDSGDEIGRKAASLTPALFNSDGEGELTLAETFDTRSDDKVRFKVHVVHVLTLANRLSFLGEYTTVDYCFFQFDVIL